MPADRLLCRLVSIERLRAEVPASPETWLSASESQRFAGFGSDKRRDSFLAGRWLLRQSLVDWHRQPADPLAWPCQIDLQGASSVPAASSLSLSLSHSGDWLACVISSSPIGLDIEDLRRVRDFDGLAAQLLLPAELIDFRGSPAAGQPTAFYRWWTLREAWLKRRGQGLNLALMRELRYEIAAPGEADAAVFVDEARGLVLALDGVALAGIDTLELGDSRLAVRWRLKSLPTALD